MSHYLGMDAGGTKTTCVLADDATVLARATAGSIKVMRVADAEAEANLASLLREVSLQSGVGLDSVACTCIGLAGISVERVRQWTSNALQARVSGRLLICGDEEIALDGAFFGETGVLVMAGTGSNVVGRTKDGVVFHIGGWGPVLSDEGSGYWIGVRAASAVMHALDMGIDTRLQIAVMQQWQITT
ncbi:MAG TPA: BadF/BadG/BcrA/BcrD ATPase family protein, partial [Acidobacteriaceae bacterium]|nr:BadF/BadG/BcrA/BcrD ATPase family protein [Acidobacteriaceae bacterium]